MFADRLQASIVKTNSFLVAGCDPVIENFPEFILANADAETNSSSEFVERALSNFCDLFLAAVSGCVAAVKPNIAFFEQYGLAGIKVFSRFCESSSMAGIPVIADGKRGDIGSTAAAYSAAYLGATKVRGRAVSAFSVDALTVNPFLGFDTLEPFLRDCQEYGKGIFVLVQTSNPGASSVQGLNADGYPVREHVAKWLASQADILLGTSGWSGVGAVVGASYPDEAKRLRTLMPTSFFLIPGLGAQGAAPSDSIAGFGKLHGVRGGGVINVSRGLLGGQASSAEEFVALVRGNVARFNSQIAAALI